MIWLYLILDLFAAVIMYIIIMFCIPLLLGFFGRFFGGTSLVGIVSDKAFETMFFAFPILFVFLSFGMMFFFKAWIVDHKKIAFFLPWILPTFASFYFCYLSLRTDNIWFIAAILLFALIQPILGLITWRLV